MKIKLDQGKSPVTVRGEIEDGPVLPMETGLPWPARITSFEATMIWSGSGWELQEFVSIAQEMDKHGNIDPDEIYRYRKHYEDDDCPAWAMRLAEKLSSSGALVQMPAREFYLV